MKAVRRHESLGSETKDSIACGMARRTIITFALVVIDFQIPQEYHRGAHVESVNAMDCSTLAHSFSLWSAIDAIRVPNPGNINIWGLVAFTVLRKSTLCIGGGSYLIPQGCLLQVQS